MAKIQGVRIKNYRSLKDITLGRVPENFFASAPLSPMAVVIGKNGVGKSTLFDAFGFLADALIYGVEEACELRGRGGFEKLHSNGQSGSIEFEISYSQGENSLPITYEVWIEKDDLGRPFVRKEALYLLSDKWFLFLLHGIGFALDKAIEGFSMDQAWAILDQAEIVGRKRNLTGIDSDLLDETAKNMGIKGAKVVELSDNRKLAIASLGTLKQHPLISAFREFIEGWYLSYFTPDAARTLPLSGAQQHLNSKGDNLANVVQFMEREHRDNFQSILDRIAEKIPGIDKIRTEKTSDGRLLLCFNDQGFQDPFYAPQMSDGTLKVFAYLLLLEDPNPPPFICIEEPENGLYHKLLETLASEFRTHATGREGGSQLFITTHQPYFVDALEPEEVWILEKGADGFSTITRASEIPYVQKMVDEGLPLGGLWYSDYLDAR